MAARRDSGDTPKRRPPARTPEGRENELIGLSFDLIEKRLREGTASSQETTLFAKMGSSEARLAKEKMIKSIELDDMKMKALESQTRTEELMQKALNAFRSYSGEDVPEMPEDEH